MEKAKMKETYPLTGGEKITWEDNTGEKRICWGKTKFSFSEAEINNVLQEFFKNKNTWYPLGASMTAPMSGGLGKYIQGRYPSLTPRHASAIAAIMQHEKQIESRGKRPIELKKK
ncbi:MAG: hypothetical protein ABH883_03200 [Candidatus Omnitrophota bacterium]